MAHVINEYAHIYAGSLSTNLPVLTSKVTVIVLGHKGTVCPVILRGWRLNCVLHAKLSPALLRESPWLVSTSRPRVCVCPGLCTCGVCDRVQ